MARFGITELLLMGSYITFVSSIQLNVSYGIGKDISRVFLEYETMRRFLSKIASSAKENHYEFRELQNALLDIAEI